MEFPGGRHFVPGRVPQSFCLMYAAGCMIFPHPDKTYGLLGFENPQGWEVEYYDDGNLLTKKLTVRLSGSLCHWLAFQIHGATLSEEPVWSVASFSGLSSTPARKYRQRSPPQPYPRNIICRGKVKSIVHYDAAGMASCM